MALLLAMYQKMRLIREKNQATLDLTKYSSKLDRVTKNIERVQKLYASKIAKLDSQAQMMQKNASIFFNNAFGIGTNNYSGNYLNPAGFGGMNGFVVNAMASMFNSNDELGSELFKKMYTEYSQNGGQFAKINKTDAEGKITQEYEIDDKGNPKYKSGYTHEQVTAFHQALQMAQTQQYNAQMQAQQYTNAYQGNVSIWLEAAKAELEAEQDAALAPLSEQETMWELEKTQADNKLKRINAQLESYDQLVSSESEKTAPTFGLR